MYVNIHIILCETSFCKFTDIRQMMGMDKKINIISSSINRPHNVEYIFEKLRKNSQEYNDLTTCLYKTKNSTVFKFCVERYSKNVEDSIKAFLKYNNINSIKYMIDQNITKIEDVFNIIIRDQNLNYFKEKVKLFFSNKLVVQQNILLKMAINYNKLDIAHYIITDDIFVEYPYYYKEISRELIKNHENEKAKFLIKYVRTGFKKILLDTARYNNLEILRYIEELNLCNIYYMALAEISIKNGFEEYTRHCLIKGDKKFDIHFPKLFELLLKSKISFLAKDIIDNGKLDNWYKYAFSIAENARRSDYMILLFERFPNLLYEKQVMYFDMNIINYLKAKSVITQERYDEVYERLKDKQSVIIVF